MNAELNPMHIDRGVLPAVNQSVAGVAQNTHILDQLDSAWAAVDALVRDGFTVLSVVINGRQPVICIQACARCDLLNGKWFRVEPARDGNLVSWQATILGAQVQWRSGGEQ